ncbi:hypothetical protein HN935_03790 [archaeon]|jgi:uncharacterized membrane protein YvlD (DUF360 family)|nr:hypothetical protein [archaeon]
MVWYPVIGWAAFWIGLIVAIILVSINKKFYPVLHVVSICLYIFTAGFLIDVFNLQKLGIMTVLIFSAVLFMVLGRHFSKVFAIHHGN